MADILRIDSHKLQFHPREVARWLDGEEIFPIYVEISPSGSCNHRCTFCALDYLSYTPRFLDADVLEARLAEMGRLGVKSIMFGGEGEPLLHRRCGDLVLAAKGSGIDVALTTNGVLLSPTLVRRIARAASWIKVSVNAGTAASYAAIHRTREEDFEQVLANIEAAARVIADEGSSCKLGVQALLLPENAAELELLAERARAAGADYLVVKSHSQHPKSVTRRYAELDYEPFAELAERLERFATDRFTVIVRRHSMRKLQQHERGYGRCLSLPFWSYIDAGGSVWGCSAFLGDERFRYGSLYEQGFEEIWRGQKRKASLAFVAREIDLGACRRNCRMDEVNRYLWELTHPQPHVNFI